MQDVSSLQAPLLQFGGWGALVAVVYWFMRRIDKQAAQLDRAQDQSEELARSLAKAAESIEAIEKRLGNEPRA